jgi:hypothetical protein
MKKWFLVQLGLLLVLVAYAALSSGAAERAEVKEIGKKASGGLEITLVSAPPQTGEEMKKMMEQMGQTKMQKMMKQKEMGGMMDMPSEPATHWLGVIILDSKTKKFIPDLKVTLTAKGPITRKVDLMPMPGSYAQNISLPPGKYDIAVKVDFPKEKRKPVEVRFQMKT